MVRSSLMHHSKLKKMQTIFKYLALSFLLMALVPACEKNKISYGESSVIASDQALLKINYESFYALNPSVQIVLNGNRVSPLLLGRTPFPGGGYNTIGDSRPDYLVITQGEVTMKISIPNKGTNTDSVVLYNTSMTLEAGKYYTAHITDTAAKTQNVLLIDDPVRPDSNYSKFKFVNLMPNVAAVDLYYGTTVVAVNIPYKGASNYFTMMIPSTTLAWTIRPAGASATSPALATYTSVATNANQRIYTAFAVGYSGSTDAARKPYISFLLNR